LTGLEDPVIILTYRHKERSNMDELKIREDEGKFYVYFNGPFGSCAYQSDPFDTLAEAEAFKQEQLDSADLGDEE
jgi:hypothetical protein